VQSLIAESPVTLLKVPEGQGSGAIAACGQKYPDGQRVPVPTSL
jgi:hypothetical protein